MTSSKLEVLQCKCSWSISCPDEFAPKHRVGCAELQKRGKTQLYVEWKHNLRLSRNSKDCGTNTSHYHLLNEISSLSSATTKVIPVTAVVFLTILIIDLRVLTVDQDPDSPLAARYCSMALDDYTLWLAKHVLALSCQMVKVADYAVQAGVYIFIDIHLGS